MTKRSFFIGDEWLYYKIYTGVRTADYILSKYIYPIVEQLMNDKTIDKWFFIRYYDPYFHLRIRFHITNRDSTKRIIESLYIPLNQLLNNDIVWKIQTDTYHREIERYGLNTIEIIESLFYHNSVFTLKALKYFESVNNENIRWLFGLRSIDATFNSFKWDVLSKREFLSTLTEIYYAENRWGSETIISIKMKYRKERSLINNIMSPGLTQNKESFSFLDIIDEASQVIDPLIRELISLKDTKELQVPLESILGNYLHMFCNRLFRTKQNTHEFVLYTFLLDYYKTEIIKANLDKVI
jgi:thiopeptide-type bacteriocin biosynthesis protein